MAQPVGQVSSDPFSITVDGDEFWPRSGKPYFHVIITKAHLKAPCHLVVPKKLKLGISGRAPVSVSCNGKVWEMTYHGENRGTPKIYPGYREFVVDNNLKEGDACFFELIECSNEGIKFRAQNLRDTMAAGYGDRTLNGGGAAD